MKKILIAILCLAAAVPASAQHLDISPYQDGFSTEIGKMKFRLIPVMYFGYSMITPNNNQTCLAFGRSFSYSMELARISVNLDHSGNTRLNLGVRWSFDNFGTEHNKFYSCIDNRIVAVNPIVVDLAKSKMRADYIGFPLGLSVKSGKVRAAVNVSAEFNTAAITKYKSVNGEKSKETIGGFNQFRSCVEGRLSYRSLGVFARACITEEFLDANGDGMRPVTVGLALGF